MGVYGLKKKKNFGSTLSHKDVDGNPYPDG